MGHEGEILKQFMHGNHIKVGELSLELGYSERNYITNLYKKHVIKPGPKQLLVAKFPELINLLDTSNLSKVEEPPAPYHLKNSRAVEDISNYGDCAAVIAAQAETIAALKAQIADKDEIIQLLKNK